MGDGGGQQYCLKWNNYQVRLSLRRFHHWGVSLPSGVFVTISWMLFQESLSSTFSDLLASDTFVDVTLSCEGHKVLMFYNVYDGTVCESVSKWMTKFTFQIVRAHRLLLSACSPYFRRLLSGLTSWEHPIIILRWSPCQGNSDASDPSPEM